MKLQLIYSFKIQIKYQFCNRFIPNQNDAAGLSTMQWLKTVHC